LIVALLVMVIMTLLGIPFLLMGETENRIAENERFSLQAQYAAESAARMVVRWFDRPMDATNVTNPPLAAIDRSLRKIDADGDPGTAPVQADGSVAKPWYKQTDDAVFEQPYRGSLVDTLLGTADGPDMRIDENGSTEARDFLEDLSEKLFTDFAAGQQARIGRIDVFAPPYVQKSGTWTRYGIASAKVTVRIHQERPGASESVLAERSVTFVLNEVPYAGEVHGPLYACKDINWTLNPLGIHWGLAMAGRDIDLGNLDMRTVSLPRDVPPSPEIDLLWAWNNDPFWVEYYETHVALEEFKIEDPWFRLMAWDEIYHLGSPSPVGTQPYPFAPWTGTVGDGHMTAYNDPLYTDPFFLPNHSNLIQFQQASSVVSTCDVSPPFPYETWKAIALQGGPNIHYYVWQDGTNNPPLFLENGQGDPQSFRDITDGQVGFFFFETTDGLPPESDGSNLTPTISLAGGTWGVRGLIYLNAEEFHAHDVVGPNVDYQSPGEPFQDKFPHNGQWDAGERWVNLDLTSPTYNAAADDDFGGGGSVVWNDRGPIVPAPAMIWGVLYNSGSFDSTGNGSYYGAVVVGDSVRESTAVMDAPDIYWDASLKEDWPPTEWGLPTVVVTRWETDL
jgi:hypothetical protein